MRQRAKSAAPAAGNRITSLQTSINIFKSLHDLRRRQWKLRDLHHLVLAAHIAFSLFILPPAPLVKTVVVASLSLLLLMPVTQQFFLPSLPIWTYLLYFFSSR